MTFASSQNGINIEAANHFSASEQTLQTFFFKQQNRSAEAFPS